ncbi:hypothetical protein PQX77_009655 [Marasmius sp. AFHP31]|nr:hypothetical protein PQX77_009655 [Marasmius sp. AFHP31]
MERGNRLLFSQHRTESTFEEIPVIDFADARTTDPLKRRELVDHIRAACINVGFFYIKNHGIPEPVIGATVQAGRTFFALPESSKTELDIHKTPNFKGYTALLGENTDPNGKGDLHESFDLGWEELASHTQNAPKTGSRDDGAMSGSNVWPELAGFRETVLTY